MSIDQDKLDQKMAENTLLESLGIQITDIKGDYIEGTMPVDTRTHQPYGLLHGGASAALIETLGSFGSHMAVDASQFASVGIEINCTHIRGKRSGVVTGKAHLVHKGRKLHLWNVDIVDEESKLIATGKLTVMIVEKSSLRER